MQEPMLIYETIQLQSNQCVFLMEEEHIFGSIKPKEASRVKVSLKLCLDGWVVGFAGEGRVFPVPSVQCPPT